MRNHFALMSPSSLKSLYSTASTRASQLASMSSAQRIALKKRCKLILWASDDYDAQLIKLCQILAKL